MKKIAKIHYISRDDDRLTHSEQAEHMFRNGINCVQIRMKNAKREEFIKEVKRSLEYAEKYNGIIIVNDSVEIAKETGAHGVHLGLNDMPADEARKILGNDMIIGGTANTPDDVIMQFNRGCDYIGLGPFRFTTTKERLSPVIGFEGYRKIMKILKSKGINIPVMAVGGIETDEITGLQSTGLYGAAISGSLFRQIKK